MAASVIGLGWVIHQKIDKLAGKIFIILSLSFVPAIMWSLTIYNDLLSIVGIMIFLIFGILSQYEDNHNKRNLYLVLSFNL